MLYALDWICIAVLVLSTLMGAWRGLLYEALSVAAWIAAYFVARALAEWVGGLLPMATATGDVRYAVGFVIVFIIVAFLGGIVASLGRHAARSMGVRPVDRTFGMVFGLARGALVLLLVAFVVRLSALGNEPWWRNSNSGPLLDSALVQVQPLLPDRVVRLMAA